MIKLHKEIPKVDSNHSNHTCLAVTSLDSALKKDENYFPQVFLKECKCIEKKVIRHIIDYIESFYDDSDESARKFYFLKYNNFFILRVRKFHFLRNLFAMDFFFKLRLKSAPGSPIYY